jgi:flagellar basal body P-ring protein FlgI
VSSRLTHGFLRFIIEVSGYLARIVDNKRSFFGVFNPMDARGIKTVFVTAVLVVCCFAGSCGELKSGSKDLRRLGTTIGSLCDVVSTDFIAVEGYGIVGGLRGTGSSECPTRIREYLKQYILKQMTDRRTNIDAFINSRDTAIVRVHGSMSTSVMENRSFDVKVTALSGTQTTSLENGWLHSTELKLLGRFGMATRVFATARGDVFMDALNRDEIDKKTGYVLGGGTVIGEYPFGLVLRKPDFTIANIIRNRLNGRFGPNTARAETAREIVLNVPVQYGKQKQRFISIVKLMYLVEADEIVKERIKTFVGKLAVAEDMDESEIALEAIGNESLSKLGILLNSGHEEVRLRAGRCMLNLGSNGGLETLKKIAMDKDSSRRVDSLEAITTGASRNDASAISRQLLRDEDFHIRFAAYEQLRELDDIAIARRPVARSFYLEQITRTGYKTIYVSRSGQARIVLFGSPIVCSDNLFIQSANGEITIDSRPGQRYASVMRKHPTRPKVVGPLRSSLELGEIIQTLCEDPVKRSEQGRIGLGVSYTDMIALLKQMCEKGAVEANFEAGPLPSIE